jgi:3',5'-cyclic AMP phosphodiesterase CpdA
MPQRFAQISDPHLSSLAAVRWRDLLNKRFLGYLSWRRKRRFEHRPEVLDALLADLRQYRLDQLLVTGDLTHVGLPQEFREARDWLGRLGDPAEVAVVPGNHDAYVAADWGETFALWREYMASDSTVAGHGGAFPSLRVRGDIAFVGVSTACPKPPLMATGTAGARQLSQLRELLADAARERRFRVVYLHHSPLPGDERWRKRLTDAPALRDVLVEQGAELIVHGHGHRGSLAELETCHGPAPVIAVPSASALGLHGADSACYNHYTVTGSGEGWRLEIETRAYDHGKGRFCPTERNRIELPRRY